MAEEMLNGDFMAEVWPVSPEPLISLPDPGQKEDDAPDGNAVPVDTPASTKLE